VVDALLLKIVSEIAQPQQCAPFRSMCRFVERAPAFPLQILGVVFKDRARRHAEFVPGGNQNADILLGGALIRKTPVGLSVPLLEFNDRRTVSHCLAVDRR
jgi:hypothetical protein